MHLLVPELERIDWSDEPLSTCDACCMLERHGAPSEHAFHPKGRCCTYHPRMPNFLVGASLLEGGQAAEVVAARLRDTSGVDAWGITASDAWTARHADAGDDGFGVDVALQCPFWVGGSHACGVWGQRTSVCRTWFCRHDSGFYGALRWAGLKDTMAVAEDCLAKWCIATGAPPAGDSDWAGWYRACAERVGAFTEADIPAAGTSLLTRVRARLSAGAHRMQPAMPDVVVASVQHMGSAGDSARLAGYSSYDGVVAPADVYVFLSRLDGTCTWRDAMAGTELDEHTVRELYRAGAVEPPDRPRPEDARGLPIWAG
jgi:hypothetical protein